MMRMTCSRYCGLCLHDQLIMCHLLLQFDTLSYQSSHSSLATSKLGTVSAVNTPLQGSLESLSIPPVKQGKQTAASGGLGDWEDKLLGYKTGNSSV